MRYMTIEEFKEDMRRREEVIDMLKDPCPMCGQKTLDGVKIADWGTNGMARYQARFRVTCANCRAEKDIVGSCLKDALMKFSNMEEEE